MELIRRINEEFIADRGEDIHWTDLFFFYGIYGGSLLFFLYTMVVLLLF